MATVRPFLWFESNMQQAVNFYLSVFKESRLISMNPMSATFELQGQELGVEPGVRIQDSTKQFAIHRLR